MRGKRRRGRRTLRKMRSRQRDPGKTPPSLGQPRRRVTLQTRVRVDRGPSRGRGTHEFWLVSVWVNVFVLVPCRFWVVVCLFVLSAVGGFDLNCWCHLLLSPWW